MMDERAKQIIKRLRRTGQGETICLMDWEVRIILELIEKGEKEHEQAIDYREFMQGS